MGISHCKLKRKRTDHVIKNFCSRSNCPKCGRYIGTSSQWSCIILLKSPSTCFENLPDIAPEQAEFKADESYFGGTRKGKQGRGTAGKVPVVGILKRGGRVYTKMVTDTKSETLFDALDRKILSDLVFLYK